ncbi:sulfatase-like hydrolase/transferase [Labilibaculum sp. DW002]|uniref:Sulfatase-like hydrolase/transferase n=1 Tax=Paralabilibaculum antarcticum TaxID=2912572 RepID=A0ABT5VUF8_9BACT|nr:sulfatase-like hydrolase/transferase [Labilibaculum sp. DW002]MDE5419059.1 sulfatase-like hydrolase/transferase [Labilibaculum sp. DW002]
MKFLVKTFLIALSALLFVACQSEKKQPNFLFVLVDDQSAFDLKIYNSNSILETPTLDKLADGGMVFESARNMGSMNGAVCTPSRHMIMSGRTVWHLPPSAEFQKQIDPHPIDTMTIGAVFNRAGYKTMRTCKKGNSYPGANRQFSVVKDKTKRGGTEESGSAWHSKQVLEYLNARESAQESDPFFIYFGFSHPHDTRNGTPELLAKYGAVNHKDINSLPPANPKQPQLPENYLTAHPFFHGHPELRDEERVSGVWKNRDEQTIRNEIGREYACDENIDIQIDKVLKKLEEMGELDNTYIIYTADHGIAIGRHGLQGKQNLYEHSWKVPFIVNGPGIKGGTRVEGNIYLLDVLPTLCDLAEIEIPETVEGKSFKSVLEGKENTIRDTMYGVYCGGTKPGMRTVKLGDWKLIKYDVMDGAVRETQLFNLAENPNEYLPEHGRTGEMQTDLAENPKYADKLKEMEAVLLGQMKKHDDPYRLWNQK